MSFDDESNRAQKCKSAIAVTSGCFYAAAWWMFIDAAAYQSALQLDPPIIAGYFLPGIIATFGLLMTQVAPVESLNPGSFMSLSSPSSSSRVRLWLFLSFAVSFGSIIASVWIMASDFMPPGSTNPNQWPGVALLLNSVGIFFASMLLLWGKMQTAEYDSV